MLVEFCLARVGFRWTLRIWAIAYGLLAGVALFYVKPRLPTPSYHRTEDRPSLIPAGLGIWRSLLFWVFVSDQMTRLTPVRIVLFAGTGILPRVHLSVRYSLCTSDVRPTWVENFATPAKASAVLAVHNVAITFSQVRYFARTADSRLHSGGRLIEWPTTGL